MHVCVVDFMSSTLYVIAGNVVSSGKFDILLLPETCSRMKQTKVRATGKQERQYQGVGITCNKGLRPKLNPEHSYS